MHESLFIHDSHDCLAALIRDYGVVNGLLGPHSSSYPLPCILRLALCCFALSSPNPARVCHFAFSQGFSLALPLPLRLRDGEFACSSSCTISFVFEHVKIATCARAEIVSKVMALRSNSLPLPPQGDIHAGAAAAGKTGSNKEQQQHPGRTKLTVNTSKMSSNSRSKPASPVLSPSAGFGAAEFNNQDPQFKMDDYFAMSLIGAGGHNHHHPNSAGTSQGKPLSAGRNGSGTQSSSHALAHSRSYSTSSNPRPEHPHSHHLGTSQAHYGGITSRPSSRASTDKLRSPHGSPANSRPSSPSSRSRSTSRYRSSANVHSPLLYGNEAGSSTFILSSGNSEYFHGHPRTSGRATVLPVLVQQTWTRWKANLGIGTGEWIDPHDCTKWVIPVRLKAYVPLLVWVAVSIAMAGIVGIWHSQVFSFLDSLSVYLKSQGYFGDFILFLCIFITTFPPLPLYSTFIFLAGYSFGLVEAFLISYAAALSGAVVVFLLSKRCLKDRMISLLDASPGLKKVVRAIERRPKLLFLIRLSPYPYNVMNVLLASSQTLSFSCYFWCTALSLPKLIIHCSVGTTIRSFAESTSSNPATEGATEEELEAERQGQRLKAIAGAVGIALCIGKLPSAALWQTERNPY